MEVVEQVTVAGVTVSAVQGDLTAQEVDAIVNAANIHLRHGGGVAGAIARAGGPRIQRESDEWVAAHGPLDTGQAAVTGGGDLPADHVIHTAGPVFDPGSDRNEPLLRSAVRGALEAAVRIGARTVAFPAISAGIYGYPPADATAVLADEVVVFLREHEGSRPLDEVRLVGFDRSAADLFADGLRRSAGG